MLTASTLSQGMLDDAGFFVRVATDIYGVKYNRAFAFSAPPQLGHLINVVEAAFDAIGRSNRPPGYPDIPFEAQTFQLFDHLQEKWADLFSSQQMTVGMQLFCFQPESLWHCDVPEGVPPHTHVLPWMHTGGRVVRKPSDTGVPASLSEMIRSVFAESDIGNKGFLTFTDIRSALERCEKATATCSVEALFTTIDQDCDGHISYEEWVSFALTPRFSDLVSALYHRFRDLWHNRKVKPSNRELALASKREAALHMEVEKEAAWHRHRAIAQRWHDGMRTEAAVARQKANEASLREQRTYEQIYLSGSQTEQPSSQRLSFAHRRQQ